MGTFFTVCVTFILFTFFIIISFLFRLKDYIKEFRLLLNFRPEFHIITFFDDNFSFYQGSNFVSKCGRCVYQYSMVFNIFHFMVRRMFFVII